MVQGAVRSTKATVGMEKPAGKIKINSGGILELG
jgi:hypothetical protein